MQPTGRRGGHALELLRSGRIPDLMVSDVGMPGLSGPELALRIHARHPVIPVLFVSGSVDGLVNPDTLGALRWEFLPKPFTPEALVDRIQYLLAQTQST
jgi:two-component system, NtrC family, C4-dicarboxylate transport response regulator DctD